jgi:peptide/nickel transport system ATP-binding protein
MPDLGRDDASPMIDPAWGSTEQASAAGESPSLTISDLVVTYRARGRGIVPAVDHVSLEIPRNAIYALIGESGSGKTSLARAVCGLVPYSGSIRFMGAPLDPRAMKAGGMRPVQMVHQNPYSALNPRWPIWMSVAEPISRLDRRASGDEVKAAARALLERVGLGSRLHERLPHQVSGGQCQRVAIARALATRAKLIVLDEAVSALDAGVKRDILELLKTLSIEESVAYLFVTHDMATVAAIATDVGVMRNGRLVESGTSVDVLRSPREDYTRELMDAVPTLDRSRS